MKGCWEEATPLCSPGLEVFRGGEGWQEGKVPSKLKRHLETKKPGRQLQVINGSVYNRVPYSQRGMGADSHLEASAAIFHTTEGPLDNFIVYLGHAGRYSETGWASLSQGL